jgi:outer membrane receptor for ferrienterochelin and colicin
MLDYYNELLDVTNLDDDFKRTENDLGAFFEYAFDNIDNLSVTGGLRVDNNNLLGFFVTPRLHVRYTPWEKSALRFSVGRGKRSANIFAENQNVFASSRAFSVVNDSGKIYGLDPEIAWNYGVSFLQGFNLFGQKADVIIDFYRTDFENQIVMDLENPQQVNFYNLDGKSYANSLQVEFNYNLFKNLDLRTAYKFYDVKTQYNTGKLEKPLTPKHRFFANASYETDKTEKATQWKFDATYNWVGKQRFPSTVNSPLPYQLSTYSPTFSTFNVQFTKVFSPKFEVYLGGENINNYKQSHPIVSADNPFGAYFDSTFVYGPIFGANYYAGLRFKIE